MNRSRSRSSTTGCFLTSTALCPTVKRLLCEIGRGETDSIDSSNEECFSQFVRECDSRPMRENSLFSFTTKNLLNINDCMKHCHCIERTKDLPWNSEDYVKVVFQLSPLFKESQHFLETIQCEKFSEIYIEHFEWTKNVKLFLDVHQLLISNQGEKDLLALLLVCSGIERALGNVYLLRGSQCPSLLKDLLMTDELKDIFGESAIKILHTLIGPPISMNLRNVAWHGFFSVGELPKRYVYFLLLLTASLNELLLSRGIQYSSINERSYYSLSKADKVAEKIAAINEHSLEKIEHCIHNSWFIGESNCSFIQDIFNLYRDGKYGFCSTLAFPVLEHILRRLFVSVNNCPDRLLTAEATTLYTTFEEILNACLPDREENHLIPVLGEPFLDILHDLLIYPNGPHARDKLGHGEADYYTVPQSLPFVLIVSLAFIAVKPYHTNTDCAELSDLMTSVEKYESQFHPLTMLKWKIIELSQTSSLLHENLKTSPELNSWDPTTGLQVFVEENSCFKEMSLHMTTFLEIVQKGMSQVHELNELKCRVMEPFSNIYDIVINILSTKRTSTLHRWQRLAKLSMSDVSESEIVNLLLRTIDEATTSLSQSQETLLLRQRQLHDKSLRSRQRENMKRLLYFVPILDSMLNYIVILSLYIFHHLESHPHSDPPELRLMQRFLKNNLQVTENLRTLTASDKNKWKQSEQLIVIAIKNGVEFVGQWQTYS